MRRLSSSSALILVGCGLFLSEGACAKRNTKGPSQNELAALKDYILPDLPSDPAIKKIDVNFDDKVHMIGWKAEPEVASPGSTVHLTIYWRKTGDLEPGWKLFTHVTTDDMKTAKGNLDCVGTIRTEKRAVCEEQLYGPSEWEKGKVIIDAFDYQVPSDTNWPKMYFLVGIWRGDARLQIRNADSSDGDNRAIVVNLPTGVKAPEVAPPKLVLPTLHAPKFAKPEVKLDGKLDEAFWRFAGITGPLVSPGDGKPTMEGSPVGAVARFVWDDTNLYVGITVNDPNPSSPFKPSDKDPHIWEKSAGIELMLQPGEPGDNKDYYEIQVDTAGAVYDTHWDDFRSPESGEGAGRVYGHMDWSSNLKSGVFVDKDNKNYTIEMAIPWASFGKPREGFHVPPTPNDVWRVNVYTFRDGQGQAAAWSHLDGAGSFHKASRFGRVIFGMEVPAAALSAVMPPRPAAPSAAASQPKK